MIYTHPKKTKVFVSAEFEKMEKIKKPCRAPWFHCTAFYEHLWATLSKALKRGE